MIPEEPREVWDDMKERSAYRRAWSLCMMPADAAAFSAGLKAAFPAIRFVSLDYWEHFVDQERFKADCLESRRRQKLGLPEGKLRRHMREPAGESLHYWDSLADPAERRFVAWIEPPGWKPSWGPADEGGIRRILNTPRLWFNFRTSYFFRGDQRLYCDFEEPIPANARESILLRGETFEVRWNPSEPDAEAFGKKVYNVLRKLTAFRFVAVETGSRRAFTDEVFGMQKCCLAGHHALDWTLKRRHNYLVLSAGGSYYKSPDYRFRRRDIFSAGELKRYEVDREEEFQERLAQLHEDTERSIAANRSGLMASQMRVENGRLTGVVYLHGIMKPASKPETPPASDTSRGRKARPARSPK